MLHRHLNTDEWTLEAIDSCLERGDLPDWRELFSAAKQDRRLAKDILLIATRHDLGGASVLARELVRRIWPELTCKS